jgi:hypothetical protein
VPERNSSLARPRARFDAGDASKSERGSRWWLRPVSGLAGCALAAFWLLGQVSEGEHEPRTELADPLPPEEPRCRVAQQNALARARTLEVLAGAGWERLPFDAREAPQATLRIAESNACYRAVGDRESVQRSAIKQGIYQADLARRWNRARLLLELARRAGDAAAMRQEIATLLALSSQGGPSARAYREHLETLDRAAEGFLLEAKIKEN